MKKNIRFVYASILNQKSLIFLSFFILLNGLPTTLTAQFYSGSQMDFGKNRVQFDEPRLWQWYKFDKYNVYFYMNGKELGVYTSQKAKEYVSKIEKFLDYSLDDKIEFMVYNKQSDYRQSNLGLEYEEPYNVGGVTKIVGSKVSLYFNGDHKDFDRQIKEGIAEVIINQMMYGGNIKDVVRNSTLLNLPNWYVQGLVSYISNSWDTDIDSRVKDGMLTKKYRKFNNLEGMDALYAGHSIWNYIAETYGEAVISNILYMTKVTRNIDTAFLFVLGVSMKNLTLEWMNFYFDRYHEKDSTKTLPATSFLKKIKPTRVYQRFKTSPDGKYAVYTTNELGRYKIWLYDLTKKKAKKILKREQKIDRPADYSFPLIAWHPTGQLFSFITERKGEILLQYYTLSDKKIETLKIFNFEKILDYSYSDDGKLIVMSAVQNGQSDIYLYTPGSANAQPVTKDFYDDLNPRFINSSSKIIFASNRPNDTIRFLSSYPIDIKKENQMMENNDLFIYSFNEKNPVLRRVTSTPAINESNPFEYDKDHLCFLSDENGIRNRYLGVIDSSIAYVDTTEHYRYFTKPYPITNYSRNIIEQDVNPKAQKITEVIFHNRKYRMYSMDYPKDITQGGTTLTNTTYQAGILKKQQKEKERKEESENKPAVSPLSTVQVIVQEDISTPSKTDTSQFDINNYVFDKELKKKKNVEPLPSVSVTPDTASPTVAKPQGFFLPQQRNYFLFFSTDYVVTQLDNSFLNATYQYFSGPGPIFLTPGLTGFFKMGLSDLFDDYKISGGFRMSTDLKSNEYYISYENRLKRLDKQIILHRQALDYSPYYRIHTHEAKYVIKWPFTETSSVRGTLSGRQDRGVVYAADDFTLAYKNAFKYWGGAKAEYVFDNTRKRGLNLYYGTRLKLFAEYFKQLNQKETNMGVVGCDIRHYTKIHRDFILANRFSASTSFGQAKLIYYMGGVDGWLAPKFNDATPISFTENYVYQTLATPMRGFVQNIRNGNSFALLNTELRLPVFRYIMNKPLKSDFFNNFQIVGFGDIGTAWTGKSPYDVNNSLNTQIIGGPPNPVTVVVQTKREPIVAGYGWGIRSRLLGYFVRLDWSYGWEDGNFGKTVRYFSLSLDF